MKMNFKKSEKIFNNGISEIIRYAQKTIKYGYSDSCYRAKR